MRNLFFSIMCLALLGAGCNGGYIDNTDGMEDPLHLSRSTEFELSSSAQDAIFYLDVDDVSEAGDARIVVDSGPLVWDGVPIFLQTDMIDDVLEMGGGLPDCVINEPDIKVWANVSLVEMPTYYEAQINDLNDVMIVAEECE